MLRPPDNASGVVEMDLGKLWFWYQTYDPEDGLICDGRTIKYVDFPELVEFLNNVQQTGNPRRDIAIPDLRGSFLRGVGGKSGGIGQKQDYAIEKITGSVYFGVDGDSRIFNHSDLQEGALYYGTTKSRDYVDNLTISNNSGANRWHRLYFDSSKSVQSSNETRPVNHAFSIVIGTGRTKKNIGHFAISFAKLLAILFRSPYSELLKMLKEVKRKLLREPDTIGDDLLITQVGTMGYYYGTTDPDNALICDGRTIKYSDFPLLVVHLNTIMQTGRPQADVQIPDCRGYFLRGLGGHSAKIGIPQGDAIRNVTGAFGQWASSGHGPFRYGSDSSLHESIRSGATTNNVINFDLSRVVPVAEENRPINIAYNIIIYTGQIKEKKT